MPELRLAERLAQLAKGWREKREEDTPVHKALREALVNALVHADFSANVSILVVKAPGFFGFRNPGRMRIPIEMALAGGHSDCRNSSLQRMFSLIGLGEQAGSEDSSGDRELEDSALPLTTALGV